MKKIYIIIIICSLFLLQEVISSESVNLYGFKPASVDSIPTFTSINRPHETKDFVSILLHVEIDNKGKLIAYDVVDTKDSFYVAYIKTYMNQLSFVPAELNKTKVNSLLPLKINLSRDSYSPEIMFPLFQDTLILDNKLFDYACEINNIRLPQVQYFPTYYSNVTIEDSVNNRYPYIIEKVSLANGEIENISNLKSTHDSFVKQLESAILYADIQTPLINGEEITTDLYLMISFFPQISYPINAYYGDSVNSSNLLFQNSIKILNMNSHLLSKPLPKRIPSDKYARNTLKRYNNIPVDLFVRIDTLGNAAIFKLSRVNDDLRSSIRNLIAKMKFYPALTHNGEIVEFYGYIRIEPIDVTNIRVSYLWLE